MYAAARPMTRLYTPMSAFVCFTDPHLQGRVSLLKLHWGEVRWPVHCHMLLQHGVLKVHLTVHRPAHSIPV